MTFPRLIGTHHHATDAVYGSDGNALTDVTNVNASLRVAQASLTNKSGGSVAAGDLLIIDVTNDDAFTTTTTAGDQRAIGIAAGTIANNAAGQVGLFGGYASVNVDAGGCTRGHYLKPSATVKTLVDTGTAIGAAVSPPQGSVGVALQTSGGAGSVHAYLLPSAGAGSGGSGALTLIQTQTLGSDTTIITFSSIPGTYKHLLLKISARSTQAAGVTNGLIKFNSDTGSNYDYQYTNSNSTSTSTAAAQAQAGPVFFGGVTAANDTSGCWSEFDCDILNYATTTFQKIMMVRNAYFSGVQTGANFNVLSLGLQWRNTGAITQIDLSLASGNYLTGSVFSLYGVS